MEQIIIPLLATIVGGFVILIIEYKYFKSDESTHNNIQSKDTSGKPPIKYKTPKEYFDDQKTHPEVVEEDQKPPISVAYQRLALILVSLVSAYASSFLFRLWADDYVHTSQSFLSLILEIVVDEDFIFLIVLLVMIFTGAVIAYLVDITFDTESSSLLPRYLLTTLVSFISAFAGCIIFPILIIVWVAKNSS